METRIIVSQIFILAVVVFIGVLAGRFRIITADTKDMLSKVIFNISLPLMLFTNFQKLDATPRLIANSMFVLLISGAVIMFMLLVSWIITRVFGIKNGEAAIFKVHSMFGNTIFLGIPLVTALFGVEGLLYASMFHLMSNLLMWTIGVLVLTHSKGISVMKNLSRVINPNTIATVTGLLFFLFSIKVPFLLLKPLSELGAANTWLSMLYIGAMLYFSNVGGLLGRKSIYILSINRLVVVPMILVFAIAIIIKLTGYVPDKLLISVILLEVSMPCMAGVVIMAKEFGADDQLAVGNVFVSTIFSIATLPLVIVLLNHFL